MVIVNISKSPLLYTKGSIISASTISASLRLQSVCSFLWVHVYFLGVFGIFYVEVCMLIRLISHLVCGYRYEYGQTLLMHIRAHHLSLQQPEMTCSWCLGTTDQTLNHNKILHIITCESRSWAKMNNKHPAEVAVNPATRQVTSVRLHCGCCHC